MRVRKFIYILLFCAPLCTFAQESSEVTQKFLNISIPDASREYTYNYGKFPTSGIKIRVWDQGPWMQTTGQGIDIGMMYSYGMWSDSIYQSYDKDGKYIERYANYYNDRLKGQVIGSGTGSVVVLPGNAPRIHCYVTDETAYEVRLQLEYTGTPDWEFSHWQVIKKDDYKDTIDTVFNLQTIEEYQINRWCKYENVAVFYIGGEKSYYDVLSSAEKTTLIPIFKKVTAVERVEMPSYSIADGRVICEEEFRIYDLVGRDVTQLNGSLRGIYILKAGKATTKIIVP